MTDGLYTLIWGGDLWNTLHNISFNYPISPSPEDKQNYKNFFTSLSYVLPCCLCRTSYINFITNIIPLTDDVLINRESLTKWVFDLHELINKKLDITYGITFQMLKNKYNYFITTCDLTDAQKINAFKFYYNKDPPFVSYELAKQFIPYGNSIMSDFESTLTLTYYSSLNRESKCNKMIKYIRSNSTSSIKNNKLTKPELYLLKYMSSTLPLSSLQLLIKND